MELQSLISLLKELAPEFMPPGDCPTAGPASRIGVCVDPTTINISAAVNQGLEVLITYHPWRGEAWQLVESSRLTILPLHTAWDNTPSGTNFTLARALELNNIECAAGLVTGSAKLSLRELVELCQRVLDLNVLPYWGELNSPVQQVALWVGPGFLPQHQPLWELCRSRGCDTIISGELTLVPLYYADQFQLKLVDPGHSAMARPGMLNLVNLLNNRLPGATTPVEFLGHYYSSSYYSARCLNEPLDQEESLPLFGTTAPEG